MIKDKLIIHCETREEAKELLFLAHSLGINWNNGDNFLEKDNWGKDKTCYWLDKSSFGDIRYCKQQHLKYITFKSLEIINEKEIENYLENLNIDIKGNSR